MITHLFLAEVETEHKYRRSFQHFDLLCVYADNTEGAHDD